MNPVGGYCAETKQMYVYACMFLCVYLYLYMCVFASVYISIYVCVCLASLDNLCMSIYLPRNLTAQQNRIYRWSIKLAIKEFITMINLIQLLKTKSKE